MDLKNKLGIIALVLVALGGSILTFSYIYTNVKQNKLESNSTNTTTTTTSKKVVTTTTTKNKPMGKVKQTDNKYILDTLRFPKNAYVNYKINDDYEVKVVITDVYSENFKEYDIYVNDKYLTSDCDFGSSEIEFSILKDNLIFLTTCHTNIRSESLYVVERNTTIHHIYQLEKVEGMVPEMINFTDNSIVIDGTRLDHNSSIIYDQTIEDDALLYDDSTWAKFGITEDIILTATYTFNFDSENKFIPTPVVTNQRTIKDHVIEMENSEQ